MRRFLLAVTVCLPLSTLLAGNTAQAATAAAPASSPQLQTIRTLQHLETVSYKAATAFYLYSVLNRDPQQFKKIQTQMSEGDALLQQLGSGSGFQSKWNALKHALTSAKFTEDGVADNASINAVDAALNALAQALRSEEAAQRTAGGIVVDKMAELLYDQYVLMQVMTSAYLRRSADYFGGAIVASSGPQVEIDQLANTFGAQLDQLNRYYQKNPKVSTTLKEITTKWVFIRNSFINFNQDNVPFIVGRYNEQITDKLLAAYEALLP